VRMQWMMLQLDEPEDFVIATGEQHSVRSFVEKSAAHLGITLEWSGTGVEEIGTIVTVDTKIFPALFPGQVIVRVDPRYFRPTEVETLLGDSTKARKKLGWECEISFEEMVSEMVSNDLLAARKKAHLNKVFQ
jgi:GDPmannose 4,6-dehydratase